MASLIESRVASLWELKNVYSLHDAMLMLEAVFVPRYNEWQEMERLKDRQKMHTA